MTISAAEPDNFVQWNDDQIVEVTKIHQDQAKKITITGKVWREKKNLFTFPCASAKLNEWEISMPSNTERNWRLEDVKSKLIRFHLVDGDRTRAYVTMVLHSSV